MPLNSVITNSGAAIALASLNKTTAELQATQKQISTGFRVADAQDDGAAFAVAERVRGDVVATQSANEQLGGAKGLLDVTQSALTNVSSTLKDLKSVVVKLADNTLTDEQRSQYQAQAKTMRDNIVAFIEDATYNGRNILDSTNTVAFNATNKIIRNSDGDYYSFAGYSAMSQIANSVPTFATSATYTSTQAATDLTASGVINTAIQRTLMQLNNFGSYSNYIESQISYNSEKMDAQNSGLGALVDADLAKESAKLQALQIRQQLGTQALSIANQAPQTLLSLFR